MNKLMAFPLVTVSLLNSACVGIVNFRADAAAANRTSMRADDVARLAAAGADASNRAVSYQHALWRCRFEQPGRPDRVLNRPADDPAIAACLSREAHRS